MKQPIGLYHDSRLFQWHLSKSAFNKLRVAPNGQRHRDVRKMPEASTAARATLLPGDEVHRFL